MRPRQTSNRPTCERASAWIAASGCFRAQTEVTCLMVDPEINARLDLVYTSPTALTGIINRRIRSTSCVTHVNVTITMTSASAFTLTWTALDSSCDLKAGQPGADPAYTRML